MPELSELSPYVRQILADNHFEPIEVLRYGPRFVCVVVQSGEREGLFKMALPESERTEHNTPPGYVWTDFDKVAILEQRILKEALFLQFFSQQLAQHSFEPQIIALSETSPVWSLRTYLTERTMAAWDSNFIFSKRFYEQVEPRLMVDFFLNFHDLSADLPVRLTDMITEFRSTLTNPARHERTVLRAKEVPMFRAKSAHLEERFNELMPRYESYHAVITQYEPYGCHILVNGQRVALIDWENVGWGHKMQDLSVLWMRCFEDPAWQAEYVRILKERGYFDEEGQLFWDSELLIQSLANHQYFAEGGPIGTADYDRQAIQFFSDTAQGILDNSPYFKA